LGGRKSIELELKPKKEEVILLVKVNQEVSSKNDRMESEVETILG